MRATILGGGCCSSRAGIIGALTAAQTKPCEVASVALPAEWIARTKNVARVNKSLDLLTLLRRRIVAEIEAGNGALQIEKAHGGRGLEAFGPDFDERTNANRESEYKLSTWHEDSA